MHLLAIGLSHKTAPVAVRERFALGAGDLAEVGADLKAAPGVAEIALLSTCNRTEAYVVGDEFGAARLAVLDALCRRAGWQARQAAPYLYTCVGPDDVAEHLFRVAAGLDSLALGETQVLGQVKEAYRIACEGNTVGKVLHELFHRALEAAKRVHRETGVGRSATSVSSAAVELARVTLGDLSRRRVLLVGAGETAELVAHHLQENFLARIVVVNRTRERADALAVRYGGQVREFAALEALLAEVDIVVSSTSAPGCVIGREALARAMERRGGRPLFVADIAVPRDVEPSAAGLPGLVLRNIDDLEDTVATNLRQRLRESRRAEGLLAEEAARFSAWVQALSVVPVIRALREQAGAIAEAEVARTLARLGPLDERQRAAVEQLAASVVNKLLDGPTRRLKRLASGPAGPEAARALADLFALPVRSRPRRGRPAAMVLPPSESRDRIS